MSRTHALRYGVLVSLLVWCWVAGSSQPAMAAAPRLIVVEGELLPQPVLLNDWDENLELILAIQSGYEHSLYREADESRPRLDILEYWLVSEVDAMPRNVPDSRIGYWPETEHGPALFGGHLAEAKALQILERHGIPTRVGQASSDDGDNPSMLAVLAAVLAAALLAPLIVFAVKRRRTSTTQR